jgi:hypothetical protein
MSLERPQSLQLEDCTIGTTMGCPEGHVCVLGGQTTAHRRALRLRQSGANLRRVLIFLVHSRDYIIMSFVRHFRIEKKILSGGALRTYATE